MGKINAIRRTRMNRLLSIIAIVLGVISLGLGVFFIYQGVSKINYLSADIKAEKITLGLTQQQINEGQVDGTAAQLQAASEKVAADRHSIAPTYNVLLNGKEFDPTNPNQLTWAQALNLENSLNVAVLAIGVTQIAEGAGAFMIIVAIALWVIGIVLWRLSGKRI
jgi:hypothetical protein